MMSHLLDKAWLQEWVTLETTSILDGVSSLSVGDVREGAFDLVITRR